VDFYRENPLHFHARGIVHMGPSIPTFLVFVYVIPGLTGFDGLLPGSVTSSLGIEGTAGGLAPFETYKHFCISLLNLSIV